MVPHVLLLALGSSVAAPQPVLVVDDPAVLVELERRRFDLGSLLGAPGHRTTRALSARTGFRDVARTLRSDIKAIKRRDPRAGVGLRYGHRLFDPDWLVSKHHHFELVAVVNRMDRALFEPGHCGQVRFIYRLAYEKTKQSRTLASRLPMTINLVFAQAEAAPCSETARRWLTDETPDVDWLTRQDGPLAKVVGQTPRSLEVNVQFVRWPSTVHPSLGGHVEYGLRVFRPRGVGRYRPAPLENTPDVGKLRRSRRAKAALLTWIRKNAEGIREGTAVMPERFAALKVTSVAPRGLARKANRPFRQLFAAKDLDLPDGAAVLRRLDTMSCSGCHQSRSVAGFHALGYSRPESPTADALAVAFSPHLQSVLPARSRLVEAAAQDGDESHWPRSQPHAERGEAYGGTGFNGPGAACGLPGRGFDSWTCAEGLVCARDLDRDVGVCRASQPAVGDGCEGGRLFSRVPGHRDRIRKRTYQSCAPSQVCEATKVGFPGGMCAQPSCGTDVAGGICGRIALLDPFNRCLARGRPFGECAIRFSRPATLRACSVEQPCRDDYVCTKVDETPQGACLPPYFLAQLRVDGHP